MSWEAIGVISGLLTLLAGAATFLYRAGQKVKELEQRAPAEPSDTCSEVHELVKELHGWHDQPDATEPVYKLWHLTPQFRREVSELHELVSELAKQFGAVAANQERIVTAVERMARAGRSGRGDTFDDR